MNEAADQTAMFVKRRIMQLTARQDDSSARATLARLRRGIGKAPGSMPELWDVTLCELPETLMGKGETPSRAEWAAHTALTLFALHQQGSDRKNDCMHRDGASLGIAVRKLAPKEDAENYASIKRRFDAAATADSVEEFAHHLRGLVQLLKAGGIALDYAALAKDLYRFQSPDARDDVRLRWGRDFYRFTAENVQNAKEAEA